MRRSKDDAEQTRQSILLAAEMLFSRKGVSSTSLDQIAREAGVTRGAIYWHFKDKHAVLDALRDKFRPPEDELTDATVLSSDEDTFVVLERCVESFLRLFVNDASRQRIFLILSNLPMELTQAGNMDAGDVTLLVANRARAQGILAEDISTDEAALMLSVFLKGLLGQWLGSGRAFDLEVLGPRMLRRHITVLRKPGHP